jgi:hypothetical protein
MTDLVSVPYEHEIPHRLLPFLTLCQAVRDDKKHKDPWKRGRWVGIACKERSKVPTGPASPLTYRALSSRTTLQRLREGVVSLPVLFRREISFNVKRSTQSAFGLVIQKQTKH